MSRKHILVADDNEAVRIMLEDVLSEAGYPVQVAEDGQQAYEMLQEGSFDLVILDLLMPQKSGFEILEWLHEQASRPLALILTGIFRSSKEVERLRALGAKGYIYKSAPVEEILYRVNNVLFPEEANSRKHPRTPVNLNIEYKSNSKWRQAFTSTLGKGGLFIRTVDPPDAGAKIEMKFILPNKDHIVKAVGEVVWCNEYVPGNRKTSLPGMGIKFIKMGDKEKGIIDTFIDETLENELMW